MTCKGLMVVTAVVLSGIGGLQAAEFGDAREGQKLAEAWCANCHVVEAEPDVARAAQVPTFPALAARGDVDFDRLTIVFAKPHPGMEGIDPSRQQLADIAAYIETLKE